MIDSNMKKCIEREARLAFESIAHDLFLCSDVCAEDSVEPTVWTMEAQAHDSQVVEIAKDYSHPDRKLFLEIVKRAISSYF